MSPSESESELELEKGKTIRGVYYATVSHTSTQNAEVKAYWKPCRRAQGEKKSDDENYESEIAAFHIDRLVGYKRWVPAGESTEHSPRSNKGRGLEELVLRLW